MSNGATASPGSGQNAEGSMIGRVVAIITPFFALGAGWLAGVVAKAVPGVNLDKGQIVAFMVAVATAVITTGWKWLQGWQQHEQNVASGNSPAIAPLKTRDKTVLGHVVRAVRGPSPISDSGRGALAAKRSRSPAGS